MNYRLFFLILLHLLIVSNPVITNTFAHEPKTIPPELQQPEQNNGVRIIVPDNTTISDKDLELVEEQAIADAKNDAKKHFNKTIWFSVGCFLPVVGPIYSQGKIKTIPLARTLGKSPEYIAFYTDNYRLEMKKQRFNWTLGGCIVGGLADACLAGFLINRYLID